MEKQRKLLKTKRKNNSLKIFSVLASIALLINIINLNIVKATTNLQPPVGVQLYNDQYGNIVDQNGQFLGGYLLTDGQIQWGQTVPKTPNVSVNNSTNTSTTNTQNSTGISVGISSNTNQTNLNGLDNQNTNNTNNVNNSNNSNQNSNTNINSSTNQTTIGTNQNNNNSINTNNSNSENNKEESKDTASSLPEIKPNTSTKSSNIIIIYVMLGIFLIIGIIVIVFWKKIKNIFETGGLINKKKAVNLGQESRPNVNYGNNITLENRVKSDASIRVFGDKNNFNEIEEINTTNNLVSQEFKKEENKAIQETKEVEKFEEINKNIDNNLTTNNSINNLENAEINMQDLMFSNTDFNQDELIVEEKNQEKEVEDKPKSQILNFKSN